MEGARSPPVALEDGDVVPMEVATLEVGQRHPGASGAGAGRGEEVVTAEDLEAAVCLAMESLKVN